MTDDDTTHDPDASPDTDPQQDDAATDADPQQNDATTDAGFDFDGDDETADDPAAERSRTDPDVSRDPARADADAPREPPARRDRDRDDSRSEGPNDRIRTYVLWAALGVLGLFSVVLLFQFYGSTMQAITDWVGPEYRSVVRSAVSLVLLCLTLVGIAQVTRELTA